MLERAHLDILLTWAVQHPIPTVLLLSTSLLLSGLLLGTWSKRRRSHTLLTAFAGSVTGVPKVEQRPDRHGFVVAVSTPEAPFLHLRLRHRAVSYLDPLDLITQVRLGQVDRITVEATLVQSPVAELLWQRGHIPSRALGAPGDAGLWVRRRLDIIASEFVVRGSNTGILERCLADLQNRFGPFMDRLSIQAGNGPHLELVLRSGRFNADELPALLHLVQTAARASQFK